MAGLEADLTLLYTLMSIDNELHETELKHIMTFLLQTGFDMENNQTKTRSSDYEHFILQLETLSAFNKETLQNRCNQSIEYLKTQADSAQKEKILDYAMDLILVDGKITPEETKLITFISEEWDIDITPILVQHINNESQ